MGTSAAAGSRHVHLTMSTPRPSDDRNEILSTPGWKGPRPVRYRMAAKGAVDEAVVVEHPDTLPCSERQAEAVLLRP